MSCIPQLTGRVYSYDLLCYNENNYTAMLARRQHVPVPGRARGFWRFPRCWLRHCLWSLPITRAPGPFPIIMVGTHLSWEVFTRRQTAVFRVTSRTGPGPTPLATPG